MTSKRERANAALTFLEEMAMAEANSIVELVWFHDDECPLRQQAVRHLSIIGWGLPELFMAREAGRG